MTRALRDKYPQASQPRWGLITSGGTMSSDEGARDTVVPGDPDPAQEKSAMKLALMALAGASIEWYDFLLYGTAAALVFPAVFFPAELPPFVSLIASLSTFAVGFVARPFGAVLFGHMGDKIGRKATLAAALVLMGVATTLIAFLPSYRSWACSRRSRSYCCDCCRVSLSVASGAVQPCSQPRAHPRRDAVSMAASRRAARPLGCFSPTLPSSR
jgi:hypothetical protein